MKLLLDQNLSPRLTSALTSVYPGSTHVRAAISRYRVSRFIVHRPQAETAQLFALRRGVKAGGLETFLALLER